MATSNPLMERLMQTPLLVDAGSAELFSASIQHLLSHEHIGTMIDEGAKMAGENFWYPPEHFMAQFRPYNVQGGILQIPVMGVLLNRFPYQLGRWATGYKYIEMALARGLDDPDVKGIAFVHDSPGGEVAGNFELNDKIFEARGQKPMRAFVADHAYSASYSLASAADQIVMTRSGGVGSIGVVTMHVEYADALKREGVKVTYIFAGKHKVDGNRFEALPASVKARIQERIDRMYAEFTGTVARNRSMDEKDVRATEALTYDAKDAIPAKLADKVGALEEEMAIFCDEAAIGEEQMAITQEQHDSAVAAARTEGVTAGKAEGAKEGATAERSRISAILASDEGKKRPKAAMSLAMKTSLTVEEASATLADMQEEQATTAPTGEQPQGGKPEAKKNNPFEQHMNNGGGANVEADGKDQQQDGPAATSQSILADFAGAGGYQPTKQ